jgi:hypothetical protein
MRQIPHGESAVPVHFEFPVEWNAKTVTGVTLTIQDTSGNELLAADALTLYTATTLDGDVARFLKTLTLDAAAGDLSRGDKILIEGVSGDEFAIVEGYDSTAKQVEIEQTLNLAHEDGDAVRGAFGDIEVDFSDADDFPAGRELLFIFTPAGSGDSEVTQLAEVAVSSLNIQGFESRFRLIYKRAYESFTRPVRIFDEMVDEARRRLRTDLLAHQPPLDIERVVDQDLIAPALMAKMAILWCLEGDDDKKEERETLANSYDKEFSKLCALPIWEDKDQDRTKTDEEVSDHEPIFTKGW